MSTAAFDSSVRPTPGPPSGLIGIDELREGFRQVADDGLSFRGAPLWSWNGDLEPEELRRQIREMKAAGLGGFFMHGRVGLITPYMGERWMDCVRACIDEAEQVGMEAWLYDENGFPSGGADGRVAACGVEYQRKNLVLSQETPESFQWGPTTVAAFVTSGSLGSSLPIPDLEMLSGEVLVGSRPETLSEGSIPAEGAIPEGATVLHFHYRAGGYVDVLSKKAVRKFIELTYDHYLQVFGDDFGKVVPGIFTDEPSYGLLPWSYGLRERFLQTKGYDLCEVLPALFYRLEGCERVRHDYWSTILEMFVEAYPEQLGTWCREHGIALTGHVAWAETLMGQMTLHGASMPFYEYMDIPGTNHLGQRLMDSMREKQVASVARQMGDRRFLCEVAGGMGWNVSFEELKWVTEWQLVLGVNLLCQHLHHYTLHGETKRDVPPSYSYQQPWWGEYKMLNDHFARLIFMLTRGRRTADILVIHPIGSAWVLFDGSDISGGIDTHGGPEFVAYNDRQAEISNALLSIHRDFDYGDERIISRHGRVDGARFVVGDAVYRTVLLPELLSIRRTTLELLREFAAGGGRVVCVGEPPRLVEGLPSDEPARVLVGAHRILLPPWPPSYRKAGRYDQPRTWVGTRRALSEGLGAVSPPVIEILRRARNESADESICESARRPLSESVSGSAIESGRGPEAGLDARQLETGQEVEHIWCQLRDLGHGMRLIFAVNFDRHKSVEAALRIRMAGCEGAPEITAGGREFPSQAPAVEVWDAASGEMRPLPASWDGEYLAAVLDFEPMQSHLLVVGARGVEEVRKAAGGLCEAGSAGDVGSIKSIGSTGGVENVEIVGNVDIVRNVWNVGNVGSVENVENVEKVGNVRSIKRFGSVGSVENVGNAGVSGDSATGGKSATGTRALGTLEISGPWSVEPSDPNALTVDLCRWAVDGGRLSEPEHTLKVWAELARLRQQNPGWEPPVMLEYSFQVDPSAAIDRGSVALIVESPKAFRISVNGRQVSSADAGWWRDIAFRKIPIGEWLQGGVNTVRLEGRLSPQTEIESIYITGDFGVRSLAPTRTGDRRTVLTDGPFEICATPQETGSTDLTDAVDLTSQGFLFYAGNARLSRWVNLPVGWFDEQAGGRSSSEEGGKQILLELDPPSAVLMRVYVNGENAGTKAWRPHRVDVTSLVHPGDNRVTLELFGSCRNLLGPHHNWSGEVLYTGSAFGFTKCPDEDGPEVPENKWVDRYCFVMFGLSGAPRLRCVTR